MKSPMIGEKKSGQKTKRVSDISKNTQYVRQIMENKLSSNQTNTTLQNDNVYEFEHEDLNNYEQSEKTSQKSKHQKASNLLQFNASLKSKKSKDSMNKSSDNSGKRQLANNEAVNNFLYSNKGEQNIEEQEVSHMSGFSDIDNPF